MFYKIQYPDIHDQFARRIALMASDLAKYAQSDKANPVAVEMRSAVIEELNALHTFYGNLAAEFLEAEGEGFRDGYQAGYRAAEHKYKPELTRRSQDKELDRYHSITRAMQLWPELY